MIPRSSGIQNTLHGPSGGVNKNWEIALGLLEVLKKREKRGGKNISRTKREKQRECK